MNKQRAIRHVNRHREREMLYEWFISWGLGYFIGPLLVVGLILTVENAEAIESAVMDFVSWVVLKW